MRENKIYSVVKASQYKNGSFSIVDDKLVDDIYLEIFINDEIVDKILTIRVDSHYLGIGIFFCLFDFSPSYILSNGEFDENRIRIKTGLDIPPSGYKSKKNSGISKKEYDFNNLSDKEIKISPEVLFKAREDFENSSQIFRETAGVHGAGLYDKNGDNIVFTYDISRFNSLLKIIGFMIKNQTKFSGIEESFIVTSSRLNSEMIKVVKKSGIKIIASRGAPSKTAFVEAEKEKLTLISFLKAERFTVFSNDFRIKT